MNNLLNKFDEFDKYVENYNMNDPMINLKYFHSYRVMHLCGEIASDIGLGVEDTYLAMVIGILHDYGRFEQWKKYKTYSDAKSIDHGDLGVQMLFENNEIEKFNIDKKYYNIIYNAIKYHNKYSYPENVDNKTKLFCEIIKDADKLDIFYLCSTGEINLPTDNSDISNEITNEFYKNKLLKKENSKNKNEDILLKLAMVYDLNFEYSIRYLRGTRLIEDIFNKIRNKEKFEPYFEYIKDNLGKKEKVYVRKKI